VCVDNFMTVASGKLKIKLTNLLTN